MVAQQMRSSWNLQRSLGFGSFGEAGGYPDLEVGASHPRPSLVQDLLGRLEVTQIRSRRIWWWELHTPSSTSSFTPPTSTVQLFRSTSRSCQRIMEISNRCKPPPTSWNNASAMYLNSDVLIQLSILSRVIILQSQWSDKCDKIIFKTVVVTF